MKANPVYVDKWNVALENIDGVVAKSLSFTNFLSLGYVDAKVALEFNQMRDTNAGILNNNRHVHRFMFAFPSITLKYFLKLNLKRYGALSTKSLVMAKTVNLADILTLTIDGEPVDLKREPLEGIVIMNICCYASGTNLWGHSDAPSFSDQQLEVVGIKSLVHFGKIKSFLEYALKLGRGTKIQIAFNGEHALPIKIDGDLWCQEDQVTMNIDWTTQVPMLARYGSSSDRIYCSTKHGYLKKQIVGPVSFSWRYCALKDGYLSLFNNAHESSALEVYPLANVVASMTGTDLVLATGTNTLVLQCAPSGESTREWFEACLNQGARSVSSFLL